MLIPIKHIRKFIFIVESQLIIVEGMAELEYNHLATVIVLFESVENHQWMIHICIIP